MLAVLGLTGVIYLGKAAAQDLTAMDANMGPHSGGMHQGMMQNSPFVSSGILLNQSPYSHSLVPNDRPPASRPGAPLVLLPVPANSMSGINTPYGLQFPGSYMPSGTPLHLFNGYAVCDPPAIAAGQRIVKITSTRSPSAPSAQQPCPIYTINGQIQQPKGYTSSTTSTIPNAAGARQ
jgi:hypothetical protein